MRAAHPLALTSGEPAGIGPEITAKAWQRRKTERLSPFFLIGHEALFDRLGCVLPIMAIARPAEAAGVFDRALPILPIDHPGEIHPGQPTSRTAAFVIESIDKAAAFAIKGEAAGIVTNPIHKEVLNEAGFPAAGHTDYLAHLAGRPSKAAVMMLAVKGLRVIPLTVHLPLAEVSAHISAERIVATAKTAIRALQADFGVENPRLAVAGLNPHAGEGGRMGREEIEIIAPAIAHLREEGLDIRGPLPADTMFHPAARARYDLALCMYHDQALIPLKTLDFEHGVNVTLGLPFIRTSPDHGTAVDIAGHGTASPASLIAALRLAGEMAAARPAGARSHG